LQGRIGVGQRMLIIAQGAVCAGAAGHGLRLTIQVAGLFRLFRCAIQEREALPGLALVDGNDSSQRKQARPAVNQPGSACRAASSMGIPARTIKSAVASNSPRRS